MPPPNDLVLRDATPADVPAIASLREAIGWGVQEWALHAVIGQPDARCVVAAAPDGTLAGIGSGIVYGPIGFVGNMVVAEERRRHGIGSLILRTVCDFLTDAGCVRLELNATSDGRPLYERHGFESLGTSVTAHVPRSASSRADADVRVRRAEDVDLDAIAAYDRPRFGGDRRRILAHTVGDPDVACLMAERDGQLAGYAGFSEASGRLGPFLADDPAVAAALMADAFARSPDVAELRLNLPPSNRTGEAWLRSLDVATEPWDGRMARGAPVPKRDETIYGMAVGALG